MCFEHNGHAVGITLSLEGDHTEGFETLWEPPSEVSRRTWSDLQEATEHGTYGVAALVVEAVLGLTVVDRSVKGPGFDYYVGDPSQSGQLFQNRMRLEVSGILTGSHKIAGRVKVKQDQTKRSDGSGMPACIVVVEFGSPRARMTSR